MPDRAGRSAYSAEVRHLQCMNGCYGSGHMRFRMLYLHTHSVEGRSHAGRRAIAWSTSPARVLQGVTSLHMEASEMALIVV